MYKKTFLGLASCLAIHQTCIADQTPHRLYIAPDVSYRHFETANESRSIRLGTAPIEFIEEAFPENLQYIPGFSDVKLSLQNRWVYLAGGQVGYDYIQPGNIYFGTDIYYAGGTAHAKIRGHFRPIGLSNYDYIINSHKEKWFNIEERIGYSWKQNTWNMVWTPFIGGGYFHRTQESVLSLRWGYGAVGLRALWQCAGDAEIGLNLEAMRTVRTRVELDRGPELDGATIDLRNVWQYRAELPLTAYINNERISDIRLVPYVLVQNTGGGKHYVYFDSGNPAWPVTRTRFPVIKSYALGARLEFGLDF